MVNISKMARAAGIGSAVGATIGGIKESRDKDGNILGGIVGGAFVGSIGGAGISAGKQALQNKLTSKVYDQSISNSVMAEAEKVYAKHEMPSNANDLNVAKNVMNFKVGDSSISISKLSDPNSLSGSQIKELAHMDAINYRSQLRGIDNLSEKDMQNATNIASLKLSSQFNDVDMQRKYQNYFHKGIEDAIGNTKPITPTLSNAEVESIETALKPKKFSNFYEAQREAWKGVNDLDDIDFEHQLNQLDDYNAWYSDAYNAHKQGYVGDYLLGLPEKEYEIVPGYTTRQAYFDGLKDSIKENLRAKDV